MELLIAKPQAINQNLANYEINGSSSFNDLLSGDCKRGQRAADHLTC